MSELTPPWEAWAGVCRLLGRLWLREVDAATWQELNQEPLRSCFLQAGGWLPDPFDPRQTSRWTQRLAEEYCRLFVGPREHRPPVQSVWEHEQFQGEPAAGMHQWWELLGWQPEPPGAQVPPDHLGLQWLTLGYLLSLCALAPGDQPSPASLDELANMAARFLEEHLLWAETAYPWVIQQAQQPFYRHLASMSQRFASLLVEQLRNSLP